MTRVCHHNRVETGSTGESGTPTPQIPTMHLSGHDIQLLPAIVSNLTNGQYAKTLHNMVHMLYICIGQPCLFSFCFVLQCSGGSCYLSSLSIVFMFSYDLSRILPKVSVSLFGYFQV